MPVVLILPLVSASVLTAQNPKLLFKPVHFGGTVSPLQCGVSLLRDLLGSWLSFCLHLDA